MVVGTSPSPPGTGVAGYSINYSRCDLERRYLKEGNVLGIDAVQVPTMLQGILQKWPTAYNSSRLASEFGDVEVHVRDPELVAQVGARSTSTRVRLRDYLSKFSSSENASGDFLPLSFETDPKTPLQNLLREKAGFAVPKAVRSTTVNPVLSIGGPGAGLGFHQHEAAWLGLAFGKKLWLLRPPMDAPPKELWYRHPTVQEHSSQVSINTVLHFAGEHASTLLCVQNAGELLVVPEGWWHFTFNLPEPDQNSKALAGALDYTETTARHRARDDIVWGVGGLGHSSDTAIVAAAHGDRATLQRLFVENADSTRMQHSLRIDHSDQQGRTLSHVAASNGHVQVLEWIRKTLGHRSHAALQLHNKDGIPPISEAASSGHVDVVAWLGDVHAYDTMVARRAYAKPNEGVLASIMDQMVDLQGRRPIHAAAARGHIEVARWLVEKYGTVEAITPNDHGEQPLHIVARFGYVRLAEWLVFECKADAAAVSIEKGASSNSGRRGRRSTRGKQPLHEAARAGHLPMVKWLSRQAGVDLHAEVIRGRTARELASLGGHHHIARWLGAQDCAVATSPARVYASSIRSIVELICANPVFISAFCASCALLFKRRCERSNSYKNFRLPGNTLAKADRHAKRD